MNDNVKKEFEQMRKQLECFRDMHRTFANIAGQVSQEQKDDRICSQFRKMTGAEETTLFLMNRKTGRFQFRAAAGKGARKYDGGFLQPVGDEPAVPQGPVFEAGHSKTVTIQTKNKVHDFCDKFIMAVPISASSGTTYGVFLCEYDRACAIDESDAEQINCFLNYVALFYESFYEIQTLREKARSLELLYDIGNKLSNIRDEDQLLEAMLQSVIKYIPVDRCSLMIIDEKKYLRIKKAIGIRDVDIAKIKVPLGMGIAGHVAMGTRPLLVKDISTEEHLMSMVQHKNNFRTNSLLIVPLVSQGEVIGVINVSNRKDGLPFSEDDMELLSKIGSEIAAVLQRSYLALQLKKTRELDGDIRRFSV